jgi:hypothetical protein
MPFSIRAFRRFPVQCAATYKAGLFLMLPLPTDRGFSHCLTV